MNHYFSSQPVYAAPVASIDRENGIIHGITIAQTGPAKGHGAFLDSTFLVQLVDQANTRPHGIKARFGHPNMCSTALGTYLGRFRNYSYSGDKVIADLYLDDTARKSPSGNLFDYVLDMAEKNPDMFGASVAFESNDFETKTETIDGKKETREYFRLKELRATDIVDDPAATDSLFSADSFPGLATQFLDENPQIMELIFSKPDSVTEFLHNYLNNSKMNLSEKVKANFAAFIALFAAKPSPEPQQSEEQNILDTFFDALRVSFPESFSEVSEFTQLQKAESLTSFFATISEQQAAAHTKLMETTAAFDALNAEHEALLASCTLSATTLETSQSELATANAAIEDLKLQLNARPSIPLNVTDPALSTGNQDKDETGKQILEAMPKDLKRKLSTH